MSLELSLVMYIQGQIIMFCKVLEIKFFSKRCHQSKNKTEILAG
jgi:hypothetical protein